MFRNGRQSWRQLSKLAAVAGPAGSGSSNFAVRQFASEAGSAPKGGSGTVRDVMATADTAHMQRLPAAVLPDLYFRAKVFRCRNGFLVCWVLLEVFMRLPVLVTLVA